MKAEFTRTDDGADVVGTAVWEGRRVRIDATDPDVRSALERVFKPSPVVVDEPTTFLSPGARGEVVIQPGSLDWFREAAFTRGPAEGFAVRLVPEVAAQGGWDPAAAYRTFRSAMDRLVGASVGQTRTIK
jgi:hypothetical protein